MAQNCRFRWAWNPQKKVGEWVLASDEHPEPHSSPSRPAPAPKISSPRTKRRQGEDEKQKLLRQETARRLARRKQKAAAEAAEEHVRIQAELQKRREKHQRLTKYISAGPRAAAPEVYFGGVTEAALESHVQQRSPGGRKHSAREREGSKAGSRAPSVVSQASSGKGSSRDVDGVYRARTVAQGRTALDKGAGIAPGYSRRVDAAAKEVRKLSAAEVVAGSVWQRRQQQSATTRLPSIPDRRGNVVAAPSVLDSLDLETGFEKQGPKPCSPLLESLQLASEEDSLQSPLMAKPPPRNRWLSNLPDPSRAVDRFDTETTGWQPGVQARVTDGANGWRRPTPPNETVRHPANDAEEPGSLGLTGDERQLLASLAKLDARLLARKPRNIARRPEQREMAPIPGPKSVVSAPPARYRYAPVYGAPSALGDDVGSVATDLPGPTQRTGLQPSFAKGPALRGRERRALGRR
mmetsp:Transcript_64794/g.153174  ORF Transcript_64794/g.153174 Transcript_64794/m.153174 type:complete len:465 (-) Transcript_64794:75-1469(-)